jgi:pyruvate dehydrogenase E2 component (dihydrolipoamide acetyltransferase)
MIDVLMPQLAEAMEEGTVAAWLAVDGDTVAPGDDLVEIETDKATMTYASEDAGILSIVVGEGETASVGAPIARLLADGEEAPSHDARATVAAVPVGAVNGGARAAPPQTRARASPLARRFAADHGVDLSGLAGSGPGGRIVHADVLASVGARLTTGIRGAVAARPLTRMEEVVARRMAEARSSVPEFTVTMRVRLDAAMELRAVLGTMADPAPTLNDVVVKACAWALRRHPLANSSFQDGKLETYDRVNVGIAVAGEGTLLVPTVFDADHKGLAAIAAETRRLARAARDGTLTADEMDGGTFTVSNLGMYGVSSFTAIFNPPQAAILAVGAAQPTPIDVGGEVRFVPVAELTLSCDHRVLYGASAAQFLADVRSALETPMRMSL